MDIPLPVQDWRPTASLASLRQRAAIINQIRQFFNERQVLEVETPLLCASTVSDLHLHSLSTQVQIPSIADKQTFYLQTSPEFAMKRLLCAGSGPIFQICKAFRDLEEGRQHNPEFTMLEWYRPGFDHHDLMTEMDALLAVVLHTQPAERLTYADAFQRYLQIDPHQASVDTLQAYAQRIDLHPTAALYDKDTWLHLLLSHFIEPQLGQDKPTFLYDFPASQAALARIRQGNPSVAERFEVYIKGTELANGYHELSQAKEQRQRFINDLAERKHKGLMQVPLPEALLAALEHGLPDCAGVALGIDRLVMLATGAHNMAEIVAFPIDWA